MSGTSKRRPRWLAAVLADRHGGGALAPSPAAARGAKGVADQPQRRRPEADEQGAALCVAPLFLIDGLRPDPQGDAEAHGPERRAVQLPIAQSDPVQGIYEHDGERP